MYYLFGNTNWLLTTRLSTCCNPLLNHNLLHTYIDRSVLLFAIRPSRDNLVALASPSWSAVEDYNNLTALIMIAYHKICYKMIWYYKTSYIITLTLSLTIFYISIRLYILIFNLSIREASVVWRFFLAQLEFGFSFCPFKWSLSDSFCLSSGLIGS